MDRHLELRKHHLFGLNLTDERIRSRQCIGCGLRSDLAVDGDEGHHDYHQLRHQPKPLGPRPKDCRSFQVEESHRYLWDLRAKHDGVPLWKELGGSSDRAAAYASGLDMPLSDAALRSYYREMAERYGITAGKLKVGRDPDRDLERMAVMRDAITEGSGTTRPSLMVDANEFWTPKQAIRRISEIERQFDLVWVEEPVRRDDHLGLARVSNGIRAAVATGENLTSISQFVPLLHHDGADVVQVSVQATGITAALRIAEMSDALGIPVALVNCPGRYAAHVAAVLPNHLTMEVIDAGRDAAFRSDHHLEGGWIILGDASGLGITFDEERLAALAVDQPSSATLGATYLRATDSGISEPGIPVPQDLLGREGLGGSDRDGAPNVERAPVSRYRRALTRPS